MQNIAKKINFIHCGTIYVEEDDYPRLAYEKSKETLGLKWKGNTNDDWINRGTFKK